MADERGVVERQDAIDSLLEVKRNVAVARKEVQSLRKEVKAMRNMFLAKFEEIEKILKQGQGHPVEPTKVDTSEKSPPEFQHLKSEEMAYSPIGYLESCFKEKNGIPRQPSVCPAAKAKLCVTVSNFTNPEHSLEGLASFSHIWVLFIFHQNTNKAVKAKVKPPRLNGGKVGVFASRSPHRPNPIGLTLAKLDGIHGNILFLSGIDILDGTPVVDIKPYIPTYDKPVAMGTQKSMQNYWGREDVTIATDSLELKGEDPSACNYGNAGNCVSIAGWVNKPPVQELAVCFSHKAERQLSMFYGKTDMAPQLCENSQMTFSSCDAVDGDNSKVAPACVKNDLSGSDCRASSIAQQNPGTIDSLETFLPGNHCDENAHCSCEGKHGGQGNSKGTFIYEMTMFSSVNEVRQAIVDILKADPRSVYRRNQCASEPYHFSIDKLNVTCKFDLQRVDVLSVEPTAFRADKVKDQHQTKPNV